ncbi:MAG: hypothetical protein WD342_17450 [Verrucomicrobiales bacterium]
METDTDLDPADGMPSRSALAQEVLCFRMQQLSETFYSAAWVEDLEFEVWEMAHKKPPRFADNDVTENMAEYFRALATLAGGWWVFPAEEFEKKASQASFIPMEQWQTILKERLP